MNTKQKIVAAISFLIVVAGFVFLSSQRMVEAPSGGSDFAGTASQQGGKSQGSMSDVVAEPVTMEGIVAGISNEADLDIAAFEEEIGDTSAIESETQALNDVTQSYDENSL